MSSPLPLVREASSSSSSSSSSASSSALATPSTVPGTPSTVLTSFAPSTEHLPHGSLHTYEGFGTKAIHVGSQPDPQTGAVIPPISLSTTYKQDAVGVHKGFEYTRSGNPNRNALEAQLAALEAGGHAALALASGSAATSIAIASLGPNAHVLSVNDVYGGTSRFLTRVANVTQNLETTFVDLSSASVSDDALRAQFRPDTKAVWIETPTNPTLRVVDVPRIVRLANEAPSRPLVIVDNTFASPFWQSPLLLGADLVLHSITKYINGHSDVLMGALILPDASSRGPNPKPDALDLEERLRFLQNAYGSVPSAFDSWLAQRGAKTLALRMKQHGINALRLARFLEGPMKRAGLVSEVIYPGLLRKGHEAEYALVRDTLLSPHARKWVESGVWKGAAASRIEDDGEEEIEGFPFGGMLSFRIAEARVAPSASSSSLLSPTTPTLEKSLSLSSSSSSPTPEELRALSAQRFLSSPYPSSGRLLTLAESLGGIESLVELPAQMTHGSIPAERRREIGIDDGLVRVSVGIEEVEDLERDLEGALRWAVEGVKS